MVTIEQSIGRRLRGQRFRQMSREITAAQQKLHKAVSRRAWHAYLDLEHLTGAREDATIAAAIRLAFKHGQRALLLAVVRQMRID
jgi:hypothetical protein